MKRLIWNRPDGSCCTTVFCADFAKIASRQNITQAQLLEDTLVQIKLTRPDLAGLTPVAVEENEIDDPLRFGREVWGHAAKIVMAKARTIRIDQIRPERDKRLVALDVDYMRADEAGDGSVKQRIAATKQALRDLPAAVQPELDAIATPEALEAWEPSWPAKL
jgi:hypothetical protein